MKYDLKALAQEHGLTNISVHFYAGSGKYSASIQWKEYDSTICEFCPKHKPDIDEAIAGAIGVKVKRDALDASRDETYRAERIARLKKELSALEAEQ